MGLVVLSGCFWNEMEPICILNASVSRFMCPQEYRSASKGGNIRELSSKSLACGFSLLSRENIFGWVFFSRWHSGDVIRAKLSSNRLKTLRKSKKNLSLMRLGDGLSPRIALVVCEINSKRLEQITRTK